MIQWRAIIKVGWFIGFLVVVTLSLAPKESALSINIWDKLQHFTAYFALMTFFLWNRDPNKPVLIFVLLHIAVGAAMEGMQYFILGRAAEFNDFVANSMGVIAALLLHRLFQSYISSNSK